MTEEQNQEPEQEQPPAKLNAKARLMRRRAARMKAIQALYQWDMGGDNATMIIEQFREGQPDMQNIEHAYFETLVHGVAEHVKEIDKHLEPHLDRSMEQLDPIERCVMRAGIFELEHQLDIPYRVVINESVELAKQFGAEDGHKYVNGVLDRIAGHLRYAETSANRKKKG